MRTNVQTGKPKQDQNTVSDRRHKWHVGLACSASIVGVLSAIYAMHTGGGNKLNQGWITQTSYPHPSTSARTQPLPNAISTYFSNAASLNKSLEKATCSKLQPPPLGHSFNQPIFVDLPCQNRTPSVPKSPPLFR